MVDLLGRPVSFIPCFLYKKEAHNTVDNDVKPVRGVISEINPHGWFRIRYPAGNTVQHECFKECDIGTAVTLLGRR